MPAQQRIVLKSMKSPINNQGALRSCLKITPQSTQINTALNRGSLMRYGDPKFPPTHLSPAECSMKLRSREVWAYHHVVMAFRGQGDLSDDKLKLLKDIQAALYINEPRHKVECRMAVNDEELTLIANSIAGPNNDREWRKQGYEGYEPPTILYRPHPSSHNMYLVREVMRRKQLVQRKLNLKRKRHVKFKPQIATIHVIKNEEESDSVAKPQSGACKIKAENGQCGIVEKDVEFKIPLPPTSRNTRFSSVKTCIVASSSSSTTIASPSSSTTIASPSSSTIIASSPSSTIVGSSPSSTIVASSLSSTIVARSPSSTIVGSSPSSTIVASSSSSTTVASSPSSTIVGSSPSSTIVGSSPSSTIIASSPSSTIVASSPSSTIVESSPSSTIVASSLSSTIVGSSPSSTIIASSPSSTVVASSPSSTIVGISPSPTIVASSLGPTTSESNFSSTFVTSTPTIEASTPTPVVSTAPPSSMVTLPSPLISLPPAVITVPPASAIINIPPPTSIGLLHAADPPLPSAFSTELNFPSSEIAVPHQPQVLADTEALQFVAFSKPLLSASLPPLVVVPPQPVITVPHSSSFPPSDSSPTLLLQLQDDAADTKKRKLPKDSDGAGLTAAKKISISHISKMTPLVVSTAATSSEEQGKSSPGMVTVTTQPSFTSTSVTPSAHKVIVVANSSTTNAPPTQRSLSVPMECSVGVPIIRKAQPRIQTVQGLGTTVAQMMTVSARGRGKASPVSVGSNLQLNNTFTMVEANSIKGPTGQTHTKILPKPQGPMFKIVNATKGTSTLAGSSATRILTPQFISGDAASTSSGKPKQNLVFLQKGGGAQRAITLTNPSKDLMQSLMSKKCVLIDSSKTNSMKKCVLIQSGKGSTVVSSETVTKATTATKTSESVPRPPRPAILQRQKLPPKCPVRVSTSSENNVLVVDCSEEQFEQDLNSTTIAELLLASGVSSSHASTAARSTSVAKHPQDVGNTASTSPTSHAATQALDPDWHQTGKSLAAEEVSLPFGDFESIVTLEKAVELLAEENNDFLQEPSVVGVVDETRQSEAFQLETPNSDEEIYISDDEKVVDLLPAGVVNDFLLEPTVEDEDETNQSQAFRLENPNSDGELYNSDDERTSSGDSVDYDSGDDVKMNFSDPVDLKPDTVEINTGENTEMNSGHTTQFSEAEQQMETLEGESSEPMFPRTAVTIQHSNEDMPSNMCLEEYSSQRLGLD